VIKIKLECWWTNSKSLNNRLIKQFVDDEDLLKYSFVTEFPDYTIIFGRTEWDKIETPKERTFYISQEPLWSPNEPKDGIHNYCSKIIVADKREYPNRDEYIERLIPMFYAGRGETDSREIWDWSLKLKYKEYDKSQTISMIVRKGYDSHYNHLVNKETSEINYVNRTNLGELLSSNKKIDIYGTHWESNGENIKGEVWNKHVGLDNYKFSVCCENTIQKNYISEKFWDSILTDTIPVYLGCSNIDDHISSDSYISLNNLTYDEMVKTINKIIDNNDEYFDSYINNVKKLKQEFFKSSKYNLWETIKELVS
jgi:hypothetical protein